MRRSSMRGPVATLSVVAALVAPTVAPASAAQQAQASEVGALSPLFEENGSGVPQCEVTDDGFLTCKPTGVSVAPLADGRVLYWNGIENSEGNVELAVYIEAGRVLRDSQAVVMDLRGSAPSFQDVGRGISGDNPAGHHDQPVTDNPEGFFGPGRPGDGITGSVVGQIYPTDPVAPPDDPVDNDNDMFCSDLSQLPDGRILVAGGSDFYASPFIPYDTPGFGGMGVPEIEGTRTAQVFDPATNTWSKLDDMKFGRWYPTLVTLPDGDQFVASGVTRLHTNSQLSQVRRTETLDLQTMTWSENYSGMASENSLPLYPRMTLAPSGKPLYLSAGQFNGFGPTGYALDQALWGLYQVFDTETNEWEILGATQYAGVARGGAFSVPLMMQAPYDSMDVLIGGGTLGPTPSSMVAMSLSEILTIDSDDNIASASTGNLNNARWFSSPVLLPDGQILITNGGNLDHVNASGFEAPVRQMELFDPETRTYTPVLSTQRDRVYHNSAVLLADGRVLIGGHSPIPLGVVMSHQDFGAPMANNEKDPSWEIYSPPYLYRGDRPVIEGAPRAVTWGSQFDVVTPDATEIESVTLLRMMNQSHTVDADQRGLELPFAVEDGRLTVTAPPDGAAAPPGNYYLFINRATADGPIPSVAAIVNVGSGATGGTALVPDLDSAATAANGSANDTYDSNILDGILSRNYPAPGFEELLLEVFAGLTPDEVESQLGPLSPESMHNYVDAMTPKVVIEMALAASGSGMTYDDLVDQMWTGGGEVLAGLEQQGLSAMGAAFSEAIAMVAQGAIPISGPSDDPPAASQIAGFWSAVSGGGSSTPVLDLTGFQAVLQRFLAAMAWLRGLTA